LKCLSKFEIVDEAKAVLMQKNNMTENEAHRYIQKNAMDSGRTMVDTATSILQIMYKE
jgi:response regulator NasT